MQNIQVRGHHLSVAVRCFHFPEESTHMHSPYCQFRMVSFLSVSAPPSVATWYKSPINVHTVIVLDDRSRHLSLCRTRETSFLHAKIPESDGPMKCDMQEDNDAFSTSALSDRD